ncbi:MAG: hypothetical protein VXV78_06850 [Pseudomonadota bacterium]|uniref:hypothetical protein n=1 Tax=Halomonadaceae TaxID=28256 RepID=UPI001164CF20|nr:MULTISPECIES: hypothetical protein [Halomonas]MEC7295905.1 hypothetical protein [Pseudomonadota bacterium]BBM05744.1 hypothetical protein HAALTHF_30600n [Halomonas axialensis]MED5253046.1 hypothetical protein [Pseudomonadota bacterium]MED5557510.1 hypothetical protein [Pseudomonadota bacterium]MEE3110393.1 hypothetical protein [Pseudomonadota bacterium]
MAIHRISRHGPGWARSLTASDDPFEETLVRLEVERALPALEPTLQEESASKSAAGGTMSHRIPMSWVTQT